MRSTTKLAAAVAAVALPALLPALASAVPYASAPAVTGTAGTFVLNQAADAVTVTYGNGTTQTIDGSTAGTKSFTLPAAGSTYQITVGRTSAPAGFLTQTVTPGSPTTGTTTPIGDDVAFASPRGVAVNKDPNSGFFGRVYVSNSGTNPGDGIFVLNADKSSVFDTTGQGARTGGLNFTTGAAFSPFRVQVGQDNNVYLGDASAPATATDPTVPATGGIYRVDGNVSDGSGQKIADGIIVGSVVAEGSTATGNLTVYAVDTAGNPSNGLFRYDVGSGPLPSGHGSRESRRPAHRAQSGQRRHRRPRPRPRRQVLRPPGPRTPVAEAGVFVYLGRRHERPVRLAVRQHRRQPRRRRRRRRHAGLHPPDRAA